MLEIVRCNPNANKMICYTDNQKSTKIKLPYHTDLPLGYSIIKGVPGKSQQWKLASQ